jgi:hypothetical protein
MGRRLWGLAVCAALGGSGVATAGDEPLLPFAKQDAVEALEPDNGAKDVPLDAKIRLRFKKPLSEDTIASGMASISVSVMPSLAIVGEDAADDEESQDDDVEGKVAYDPARRELVFTPKKPLPAKKHLAVVGGVYLGTGMVFQTWSFRTAGGQPTGQPKPTVPEPEDPPKEAETEEPPAEAKPAERANDAGQPTAEQVVSTAYWLEQADDAVEAMGNDRSSDRDLWEREVVHLAALHLRAGGADRARTLASSLDGRARLNALLVLGRVAADMGDLDFVSKTADATVDAAQYLVPDKREDALACGIQLLLMAGRGRDAAAAARAAKISPTRASDLFALEAVTNAERAEADVSSFDFDGRRGGDLLLGLANGWARRGDVDRARRHVETARRSRDLRYLDDALRTLGMAALEGNRPDVALWAATILGSMRDDFARPIAAVALARRGDFEAAWKTTQEVREPWALVALAVEAIRRRDATWEGRLVPGARDVTRISDWAPVALGRTPNEPTIQAPAELARAYFETGRVDEALAVVPQRPADGEATWAASTACAVVAKMAAERGDLATYRRAIERALALHTGPDEIAEARIAAGDVEGFRLALERHGAPLSYARWMAARRSVPLLRGWEEWVTVANRDGAHRARAEFAFGAVEGLLGIELEPANAARSFPWPDVVRRAAPVGKPGGEPVPSAKPTPTAPAPTPPAAAPAAPSSAVAWLRLVPPRVDVETGTPGLMAWTAVRAGDAALGTAWLDSIPDAHRRSTELRRLADRFVKAKDWPGLRWCAQRMEAAMAAALDENGRRSLSMQAAWAYAVGGDLASAVRLEPKRVHAHFVQQLELGNLAAAERTLAWQRDFRSGVLFGAVGSLVRAYGLAGQFADAERVIQRLRDPALRDFAASHADVHKTLRVLRAAKGDLDSLEAVGGPKALDSETTAECVLAVARRGHLDAAQDVARQASVWPKVWVGIAAEAVRFGDADREQAIASQLGDDFRGMELALAYAERGRADDVAAQAKRLSGAERTQAYVVLAWTLADAGNAAGARAALEAAAASSPTTSHVDEMVGLYEALGDRDATAAVLAVTTRAEPLELAWLHVRHGAAETVARWVESEPSADAKAHLCAGAAWGLLGLSLPDGEPIPARKRASMAPKTPEPAAPRAAPPASPTDEQIRALVKEYYEERGIFARRYRLVRIDRIRVERHGPARATAHVAYWSQFVNHKKPEADRRTFLLEHQAGSWVVTEMGDHQSATFPGE